MAWEALRKLIADYTMQAQSGAVLENNAQVAHHRHSRPGASAKARADADSRPVMGMQALRPALLICPAGPAGCLDFMNCNVHCVTTQGCER